MFILQQFMLLLLVPALNPIHFQCFRSTLAGKLMKLLYFLLLHTLADLS